MPRGQAHRHGAERRAQGVHRPRAPTSIRRQPSLRLVADIFRFVADEGMSFNPISISGYHMREAGATAVQEVGFTLANALEYVRVAVDGRALGGQLRAAALLLLRQPQRSLRGSGQVPRRPAALGPAGPGAVRRRRRDRAAPVPHPDRRRHPPGAAAAQQRGPGDGAGARRGARRHPVAAHQRLRRGPGAPDRRSRRRWRSGRSRSSPTRAGSAKVVDPLAGSYYVESLTDAIERGRPRAHRGSRCAGRRGEGDRARVLPGGDRAERLRAPAARRSRASGSWWGSTASPTTPRLPRSRRPTSPPSSADQGERLADARSGARDADAVAAALAALRAAAGGTAPLMPPILDAVRARATLGEISDTLRAVWGVYRPA